ncbi:hypothetical protein LCGC14_0335170 [marine sediment metagenome]|uniref:Alanine racemase N-terminal domain-containing protein n=1 Tax=marine sediment metagenome TaxID=412755 RepID=A0A0F9TKV3_9ZZZZ|nr:YggS family pyridoxal phosphate-dependent enzyme [Phycisphaerae bacterium]HDZ43723.1 YggS family pyridoxal phosphate-dependent enzyme [Phycisphaerae bacterium]
MAVTKGKIQKNLAAIRETIAEHCQIARRDPSEVSIVAVVKSVDLETIKNLLDVGLTEFGESRVPHMVDRAAEIDAHLRRRQNPLPRPLRWHMVGHLQRNKARAACGVADVIHSIDSLRLAEEVNKRAEQADKVMDVMLQVNCSQEKQKSGCAVGASVHLGEMMTSLKNLRLVGLMTMGPLTKNMDLSRHTFTRLREIFEEMQLEKIGGADFRHLSMGMSNDYAMAVEEGATIVRIGTALFK